MSAETTLGSELYSPSESDTIPSSLFNYQPLVIERVSPSFISLPSIMNIGNYSTPSISSRSKPKTVGSGSVLWKPISEKDRNLVVLTPASFGKQNVGIYGPNNNLISSSTGFSFSNPNRPTYRFPNPGSYYGPGVRLKIGDKYYPVSNPGSRSMLSAV